MEDRQRLYLGVIVGSEIDGWSWPGSRYGGHDWETYMVGEILYRCRSRHRALPLMPEHREFIASWGLDPDGPDSIVEAWTPTDEDDDKDDGKTEWPYHNDASPTSLRWRRILAACRRGYAMTYDDREYVERILDVDPDDPHEVIRRRVPDDEDDQDDDMTVTNQ